ncbi:MAG: xanthine dehydrogenase family protein molybdopterin-binding subunit [Verrucomicrobia bacterium]|nr:xanthine dehydrogenase family protein molybdopterin-binding subunit [Verrucomicrobiota bacterium]
MATAKWPAQDKRKLIGKRIDRLDGPAKATGAAKYAYDINRPGMLWAKLITSPHARAEAVSVDFSGAKSLPGVQATWENPNSIGKDQAGNGKIQYVGQIVAAIAADTEEIAKEAASRVKVQYVPMPHQANDRDPQLFQGQPGGRNVGNVEEALAKADVKIEGEYGIPVITHCCLESHGQVAELNDGKLTLWPSTQAVSSYADVSMTDASGGLQRSSIHVDCQHMGGGFGSKFNPGTWGVASTALSKQAGRPVKLMLDRDEELMIAGNRPSAYAKIKVGAAKDGTITAIDAEVWGTAGPGGGIPQQVPYVIDKIPNIRLSVKRIATNRGPAAAWRAPNHPQQCFLTMSAFADTAAALKMDELQFFLKNAELTARPDVYKEELNIAADLIGYKQKAHLRGDPKPGSIKRGLGMSMHTWGGRGHRSECDVTINPDGSVEAKTGSQDLGVGTRTVIAIVVAETLGLPLEAVKVEIGRNSYPASGGSGGSTTVGGVSTASRLASTDALNALLAVVAPKLGVQADALEASDGYIRQIDKPNNRIAWKNACALLGVNSITKRGLNDPGPSEQQGFISQGVGGVQMADVSVDIETGVVTVNEMVGVQDCGLIIDLKTAESQVYGSMIMGIAYAIYEEAVYDFKTGRMLNADMEFYRLAGLKDVGKLKVHMMTSKAYEDRGVIGLGEPPVISPGAAIANAVANACGVRVPHLPLTPDRVIAALQKGGIV